LNNSIYYWGLTTKLYHWLLVFMIALLYLDIKNLILHELIGISVGILLLSKILFMIFHPESNSESIKNYFVTFRELKLLNIKQWTSVTSTTQPLSIAGKLLAVSLLVVLLLECITGTILLFSEEFSIFSISSIGIYQHSADNLSAALKFIDGFHSSLHYVFILLLILHLLEITFKSLQAKKNYFCSMWGRKVG